MNIKDLRYLVAIAEVKHFGKAANVCNISQPTLSMQLKKLEDYLDVQLVERNKSKVMLTDIGKIVYDLSKNIILKYDELIATARHAHNLDTGDIKIGIISTAAKQIMAQLLPELAKDYPKLSVLCYEGVKDDLVAKVKNGELDCVIVCMALDGYGLEGEELFSEKLNLLVSHDSELITNEELDLAAIEKEQIILLENGHCLREQVLNICSMARARNFISFNATSLDIINYMVSNGQGISFIPESCKDELTQITNNKVIRIKSPSPKRTLGMYWRHEFYKKELILKIVSMFKNNQGNSTS